MTNPQYKTLISGEYNIFKEGWNGCGVYVASGLYASTTFKYPIYIGSSVDLRRRIIKEHIPELNTNTHDNPIFQAAWNNHSGHNNFIWILLEACNKEDAAYLEQDYFNLYRPFADEFGGFNINHFTKTQVGANNPQYGKTGHLNGWFGKKHNEETLKKASERFSGTGNPCFGKTGNLHPAFGNKMSQEFKENLSLQRLGDKNPFFKKTHNEETRQKMSENNTSSKPVLQISLESQQIINWYPSARNAAKQINFEKSWQIGKVCNNQLDQAAGYKWQWADKNLNKENYLKSKP